MSTLTYMVHNLPNKRTSWDVVYSMSHERCATFNRGVDVRVWITPYIVWTQRLRVPRVWASKVRPPLMWEPGTYLRSRR